MPEGAAVYYSFDNVTGSTVYNEGTAGSAKDEIRAYHAPGVFVVLAEDVDSDPASPYASFDNSVAYADNGRVAFIANLVGGGRGVFLTNGTSTTTIATAATSVTTTPGRIIRLKRIGSARLGSQSGKRLSGRQERQSSMTILGEWAPNHKTEQRLLDAVAGLGMPM